MQINWKCSDCKYQRGDMDVLNVRDHRAKIRVISMLSKFTALKSNFTQLRHKRTNKRRCKTQNTINKIKDFFNKSSEMRFRKENGCK